MTTFVPARAPRTIQVRPVQERVLEHPGHFFSPDVENELARSDHEAWTAICTILLTIVTVGLVIGVGAVLLAL